MLRTLFLLLLALQTASAWASDLVLRTAAQEHALTKYDTANPQAPGLCVEIAHAIEKIDPGLSFSGFDTPMPLPRILALMKAGQLDVFIGAFHTRERDSMVDYLDQPLYQITHRVAVRADDTIELSGMDELRRLAPDNIVMTLQGTAYDSYLRSMNLQNLDVGTADIGILLKKLVNGRGRFAYESDLNLTEAIRKNRLEGKVRILPVSFKSESQFAVVRKSLNPVAAARLESDLEQLEKNGELKRIYARYAPK